MLALAQLFSTPLAYARETMSSATNLGVFLPFLDDSVVSRRGCSARSICSSSGGCVSLAIGLGVLYRKRTGADRHHACSSSMRASRSIIAARQDGRRQEPR